MLWKPSSTFCNSVLNVSTLALFYLLGYLFKNFFRLLIKLVLLKYFISKEKKIWLENELFNKKNYFVPKLSNRFYKLIYICIPGPSFADLEKNNKFFSCMLWTYHSTWIFTSYLFPLYTVCESTISFNWFVWCFHYLWSPIWYIFRSYRMF